MAMCNLKKKNNSNQITQYGFGQKIATVEHPQLDEISGIAPSARYTDCFWVNNDSGDDPNIYLINISGELIATLSLETTNRDWEAITIADGMIYIGEVGDNLGIYPYKSIYRVAEPTEIDTTKREQTIKAQEFETMRLNFSEGKRDCETMMYDPITSNLVLVSKRETQVMLYITPFIASASEDQIVEISHCGRFDFTLATAGDISPAGDKILIKNYVDIFYWSRSQGQSLEEALSAEPTLLPYDPEPQGEAIAWSTYEDAFYTISEKNGNISPIIYRYEPYKK